MSMKITKNGIITASGNSINENICNWGYSRNPRLESDAGNTKLEVVVKDDCARYTATTAGNEGGKYSRPCNGNLVVGTTYTWSCEVRSNTTITFPSRGFLGFEGGGQYGGTGVIITPEWKRFSKSWAPTMVNQAFTLYPSGALTGTNWIEIRNLKCELGSIATPYTIPASETDGYVGVVQGVFDNFSKPARIGSGYISGYQLIEIYGGGVLI